MDIEKLFSEVNHEWKQQKKNIQKLTNFAKQISFIAAKSLLLFSPFYQKYSVSDFIVDFIKNCPNEQQIFQVKVELVKNIFSNTKLVAEELLSKNIINSIFTLFNSTETHNFSSIIECFISISSFSQQAACAVLSLFTPDKFQMLMEIDNFNSQIIFSISKLVRIFCLLQNCNAMCELIFQSISFHWSNATIFQFDYLNSLLLLFDILNEEWINFVLNYELVEKICSSFSSPNSKISLLSLQCIENIIGFNKFIEFDYERLFQLFSVDSTKIFQFILNVSHIFPDYTNAFIKFGLFEIENLRYSQFSYSQKKDYLTCITIIINEANDNCILEGAVQNNLITYIVEFMDVENEEIYEQFLCTIQKILCSQQNPLFHDMAVDQFVTADGIEMLQTIKETQSGTIYDLCECIHGIVVAHDACGQ